MASKVGAFFHYCCVSFQLKEPGAITTASNRISMVHWCGQKPRGEKLGISFVFALGTTDRPHRVPAKKLQQLPINCQYFFIREQSINCIFYRVKLILISNKLQLL
jgi:hypothetical protein